MVVCLSQSVSETRHLSVRLSVCVRQSVCETVVRQTS